MDVNKSERTTVRQAKFQLECQYLSLIEPIYPGFLTLSIFQTWKRRHSKFAFLLTTQWPTRPQNYKALGDLGENKSNSTLAKPTEEPKIPDIRNSILNEA